jgi:hypothetical protein
MNGSAFGCCGTLVQPAKLPVEPKSVADIALGVCCGSAARDRVCSIQPACGSTL